MADNLIDLNKIFNFNDTTPLDQVIAKTQQFNAVLETMLQTAQKSAQGTIASMQAIQKSVESLEAEVTQADVTTKKGQDTIANGAATTAKAVAQNEEYKKSLADLNATIKMLQEQIDKLSESNKKIPKDNEAQSNSLADLKKQLKDATDAWLKMGDSTDSAIKQKALKNVTDLNTQVKNGQQILNDAKRATDSAAGSYNDLSIKVANATKQLKAMEGGVGSTSQEFKHLQEFVKSGNDKLKEFDSSIGNSQRHVGDYKGQIEQLAGKFGEFGEKGIGIFGALEAASKSWWSALVVGAGLAIASVKEFFNRTEEGALQQDIITSDLEFHWAKVKDALAGVGKNIMENIGHITRFADAQLKANELAKAEEGVKNASTEMEREFYEKKAKNIKNEIKDAEDANTKFIQLAYDREELMKQEIDFNENVVKKRIESAKLMENARQKESGDYKDQSIALSDVTKAIALKKEADAKELEIVREKARITREYTIVVKGTSTETMKALSEQDKAVAELEASQINALRRMQNMQNALLKKADAGDPELQKRIKEQNDQLRADGLRGTGTVKEGRQAAADDEQSRINQIINIRKFGQEKLDEIFKQTLADAKKSREKEAKEIEDSEERRKKNEIELAQAGSSAVMQIANDQYSALEQRQALYMQRLSENYQEDMEIAGTNTAAKIQLTEQYRAKELQAQKDLIKIKQKQAEFDKLIAAFKIGLTIAEDIAEMNYVGAAIAGGELIAVEAKPLPQFFKGTTYSPEGLALVGERGAEIGIDPKGKLSVYDEPQIAYLKEGSRILNAEVSQPILEKMDTKNMDILNHQLVDIGIRDFKSNQSVSREIINKLDEVKMATTRNKPAQVNYAKVGAIVYEFKKEEETYVKRTKALSMGSWL